MSGTDSFTFPKSVKWTAFVAVGAASYVLGAFAKAAVCGEVTL